MDIEIAKMLAVAIIATLGLLGPAMAIGLIGHTALTGMARNPEATQLMPAMIMAIAFAEAIGIYALILAIIMLMII